MLTVRCVQADAKADAVERAEAQSATLEALLEIFFRVLKQCTASGLHAANAQGGTLILHWASMQPYRHKSMCCDACARYS